MQESHIFCSRQSPITSWPDCTASKQVYFVLLSWGGQVRGLHGWVHLLTHVKPPVILYKNASSKLHRECGWRVKWFVCPQQHEYCFIFITKAREISLLWIHTASIPLNHCFSYTLTSFFSKILNSIPNT